MIQFVKILSGAPSRRQRSPKAPRRGQRPRAFEALESRRMFDASGVVSGSTLFLYGTTYNDVVVVSFDNGSIVVKSSSNEQGGEAFNHYDGVTNIKFFAGAGNDQFLNNTNLPIEVYGGPGKDYINVGNSSKAIVFGEQGNDVLMGNDFDNVLDGGDGNDTLYGFGGNDILFGGANYDQLFGGQGRDILFGGTAADKLAGGEGIDFLDGGLDNTLDTLYSKGDGASDVRISETGVATLGDKDGIDRSFVSGDDYEAQFRETGALPVSIGVTASGYVIGGGISFEFAAEDHDVSVVGEPQINPNEVDASFANWMGQGLNNYDNTGVSARPTAEVIEGNHVEQTPVDRSEPFDPNAAKPVDVSPTDPVIDAYNAQLAVTPVTPTLSPTKSTFSTSFRRF